MSLPKLKTKVTIGDPDCCGGEFPEGTKGVIIGFDLETKDGNPMYKVASNNVYWWYCHNCLILVDDIEHNIHYEALLSAATDILEWLDNGAPLKKVDGLFDVMPDTDAWGRLHSIIKQIKEYNYE